MKLSENRYATPFLYFSFIPRSLSSSCFCFSRCPPPTWLIFPHSHFYTGCNGTVGSSWKRRSGNSRRLRWRFWRWRFWTARRLWRRYLLDLYMHILNLTLTKNIFLLNLSAEEREVNHRKRKKGGVAGGMRKTRGMIERGHGPKSFRDYVEEAQLDRLPDGDPSYLTAAVGPPATRSARKLCSVCGDRSSYTCVRCGTRFCCIKCYVVHTDTRCLKFMA